MRKILTSPLVILAILTAGPASAEFGADITAPVPLKTSAAGDASDWRPKVVTDGAGNWVAVWYSIDTLGGTIGTDFDILVSRSSDNGVTWTRARALNETARTDTGADSSPRLATDGLGTWVVVWNSSEDVGGTIDTDYDLLFARSTDNGASWTYPEMLNTNAAVDGYSDYKPQVATDGVGNWVVAWESYDHLGIGLGFDPDILVTRSIDNGLTWSYPEPLNANAASDTYDDYDYDPQIATDGAGNWVAVWYTTNSMGGTIGALDYDLLMARSSDNGVNWTYPEPLNGNATTDSGHDEFPDVMSDGSGNWLAVWQSDDDLGGTIGTDIDIFVARSRNNGVTWSYPVPLNTNADTDSGDDFFVSVIADGVGHWVATWQTPDDLGGTIGTDYDVLVARSPGTGVTWTYPEPLNTSAYTDIGNDLTPHVTPDGFGHWIGVWMSDDDMGGTIGPDYDILVARWTLCCMFMQSTFPWIISYGPAPFDMAGGLLSDLAPGGDFSQATCLGTFTDISITDPLGVPPIGDGFYYLARGIDSCPSYGDSGLDPDPRDSLDSGDPCP